MPYNRCHSTSRQASNLNREKNNPGQFVDSEIEGLLTTVGDNADASERRVLRWAGLAGILGFLMNISSFVAGLFAPPLFVPAQPAASCGPACYVDAALSGFPSVKVAIVAENVAYFAAIILFIVFFLGLFRAVRAGLSLAPAIFGTGISLLGLAMEFVGALPAVAFAHLSEVYQASNPQDQASLVLVSHAVQSIFNATDATGGLLIAIGFIMFGVAMQKSTGFNKKFSWATIVLSLVAIAGISLVSIAMDNPNDPFFAILFLVLPLILGANLYRLSKLN